MYFNLIFVGKTKRKSQILKSICFYSPVQLRYNQTLSMFGIDQVHQYVLKLVDADKCPEMDENCPEADKLDITRCLSGMLNKSQSRDELTYFLF
jgi:hypothetical protein